MSIDWDRRQGALGKHKHLQSDIVDETTGEIAIDPTGADEGDSLQIVAGHQAFAPPTGAGATQTVSILGPYRVAFDTEGVNQTGGDPTAFSDGGYVQLGAMPDGAMVIGVWAERVSAWAGGGGSTFTVSYAIQADGDVDNSITFASGIPINSGATIAGVAAILRGLFPSGMYPARSVAGAFLMASGSFDAPPTQGEADLYALIALAS